MDDHSIILTRHFDAPVDRVWAAWTDPLVLPRWFGPKGYHCVTKEIDLRSGGLWRFDMIGPDGTVWPNRHRDLIYVPMSEIRFQMDDDGASTNPPFAATIQISPDAGGTLLVQTMNLGSAEAKAGAVAFGAVELGQTTLDKLAAILAR
jgi:uncharacterized protein YndB with AHSA1/START domain